MSATFWRQIHGGSTHLPIVLLLTSVVFDLAAWRSRDETLRRGLHTAGYGSAVVGLLGAIGAVIAGLVMTRGRMIGGGDEKSHHLFVWPALALCLLFVGWRLFRSGPILYGGSGIYLAGMSLTGALMVGAGYSGGEMLLAAGTELPAVGIHATGTASTPGQITMITAGTQLFLKNCAHCHGADARGNEGPDLHKLDWTDVQIATRIRNGKKGQMTAFARKFSDDDIGAVIAYLRTLK